MSWAADLQIATFRGLQFECLAVADQAEHVLVEHRYPYLDGADIEDMGTGPRQVSLSAIFFGDSYEQALEDFIAALNQTGNAEFVHPVFGYMPTVQVSRFVVQHEAENVDQAQVNFELINSTAGAGFFNDLTTLQSIQGLAQKNAAARAASKNTLNNLMLRVKALNPMNQLALLRQKLLGPIFAMKAIVSQVITSGLDVISAPFSWAADLTNLAAGVVNIAGFSPSALFSSFNSAASRLSRVLGDTSPTTAINSQLPKEVDLIVAAQVHVSVELSATLADCASAVFAAEIVTPTLTPTQIEAITNTTREQIETTLALVDLTYPVDLAWPIIEALKNIALAVQQSATVIIDARPPIITRQVLTPMPIRLLAFTWYGDHARASELMLLNALRNPNFLMASDELVCYAH